VTTVGLDDIGTSTTLESNKSQAGIWHMCDIPLLAPGTPEWGKLLQIHIDYHLKQFAA